jgi:hypothetical protein
VGDVINLVAVILVASWAVGFFALNLGIFIHVFLLIAIIALIFRVIQSRRIL